MIFAAEMFTVMMFTVQSHRQAAAVVRVVVCVSVRLVCGGHGRVGGGGGGDAVGDAKTETQTIT